MTHTAPTESVERSLGQIVEWQRQHEKHDDERFVETQRSLANVLTKEDLDDAVQKALVKALFSVGRGTKLTIITIATIVGSMAVIGGGFQWVINLFGFHR